MATKDATPVIKELMRKPEHIRNIGIVAHIDHGKCVSPDSRISLFSGENIRAEELFERFKCIGTVERESVSEKVVNVEDIELFVNSFNKKKGIVTKGKITHLWKMKKSDPLVEVKLRTGVKVKTTPEHKFMVLERDGSIGEKRADCISEGDNLVCARKLSYKPLNLKEIKVEILTNLERNGGFYTFLEKILKKELHRKILAFGRKKSWEKICSPLKWKSLYHCSWRGSYRLNDLIKLAKLFGIDLDKVYDNIKYLNYRKTVKQRGDHSSVNIKLPRTLDDLERLFYLIGVYFGDGNTSGNIDNMDPEIHRNVKSIAKDILGIDSKVQKYGNKCPRIYVAGGLTLKMLLNSVFAYPLKQKSRNIRVPVIVEKTPKPLIRAFIQGYFNTDGTVEKSRSAISISSASNEMVEDLQLLLNKFDCASTYTRKSNSLYISGKSSVGKFREIGFSLKRKRKLLEELFRKSSSSVVDRVDIDTGVLKVFRERVGVKSIQISRNYSRYEKGEIGLTKSSLQNILSRMSEVNPQGQEDPVFKRLENLCIEDTLFSEVKNVKRLNKEKYVYDFTVSDYHNFVADGVIVHNTTLTDNLLAGAGMISEELAGKQLAMDFVEQEQERGITIYSANVSMVHDWGGKEYLINLIDTPGHVDFGGDVTRAMRAVDGVVVVIDAVEAVMPQTETVVRQALKERVRPILFVNKVDRLIKELKLTPEQMQERFKKIIDEVNVLIKKYGEKEFVEKWIVNVNDGSIAFGSAVRNWAISIPYMQKSEMTFKDVIDLTNKGPEGEKELAKKAPLHTIVLDMVIKHMPNPLQAQGYRIAKIWPGESESEVAKGMANCNPDGKLAAIVTKLYPDPHAGYVATVRIFSGKMKTGQEVYLVGADKTQKIQQVSVYKGQQRIGMEEVDAGNIVGIVGLRDAFSGETICDPQDVIPGFESITHIFEPVVVKAIEPKKPQQLAKLIEFLKRVAKEDPTLKVKINEDTGEYLVSGLGELHIDAKIERPLKEEGLDVSVSSPIVIYRESIRGITPEAIEGKSPNKHNKFFIISEPLEGKVHQAMIRGEIPSNIEVKKKDVDLQNKVVDLGFDRDESKKVKQIHNRNVFLDMSRGVHAILEVMEMVKQSFREAMEEGPLAREPCDAVKVKLVDAKLHEDAIHRGPAQVVPAVRSAIRQSMISAKTYMLEPKQIIRIDVPTDQLSGAMKEVQNRRGQVLEMKEERGTTSITSKLPVAEMFGFNSSLKSSTSGQGFYWLIDVVYEPLPRDLSEKVIKQIKQRKGITD